MPRQFSVTLTVAIRQTNLLIKQRYFKTKFCFRWNLAHKERWQARDENFCDLKVYRIANVDKQA